jgi:adenylate cyclase
MQWLQRSAKLWLRGGLIGLVVGLVTFFGLFEKVEHWALNAQFHLRGPVPPKTPIIIISIDEDSFDELNLQWPWPRALHGKFLNILSRGKPAAIGFDILFSEPSSRGDADDRVFAKAIGSVGNVVLAAAYTVVEESRFIKENLNPPLPVLRERAAGYGFVNFTPDEDAFVRSAPLNRAFQGQSVPSFSLQLYRLGAKTGIPAAPLPSEESFFINYSGGPKTFPTIPFYRVLNGEVPPEAFSGKIILVGSTSPVLHDVYPAPFAVEGGMPGVEINANVLENLFQGIPLRRAPRAMSVAFVLAAAIFSVWLTNRLAPLWGIGLLVLIGVIFATAVFGVFVWGRFWMDVSYVLSALMLGYGATVVENFIRVRREKQRLSRFFSPAVLTEVIRQRNKKTLASSRQRVTVLFSDIRGFTSIAEKLPPEKVAQLLQEHLTAMTEIIFDHGGTVDKFIGDGIMALFGAPLKFANHAERAVGAALAMQAKTREFFSRWVDEGAGGLQIGVGINTGDAVVGILGSAQRLEYTAIGDTVNLASRLEGLTKDFSVPIIVSDSTFQDVQGLFSVRDLGELAVRGKAIAVKMFAVDRAEERRAVRVPMERSVTIIDGEISIPAEVMNLSRTGLAVRGLTKPIPRGQLVKLRLEYSGDPSFLTVDGRAVWCYEDKGGFKFVDLSERDSALIGRDALDRGA